MKFLKRILLFILSFTLAFSGSINVYAANEPYVKSVIATYGEESKNVLNQVMEIDGGVMDDISIKVNWSAGVSGYTYSIAQYDDSTKKRYDLVSAKTPEFKLPIDDMYADIPLYIMIHDSKGNNVFTRVIFIRVNKGRVQEVMPEGFESVYKTNVELNMDELIPGMNFQMHPYFLPITAKVFTDGRMVIGLGINSSNVSFWKDARNGTIKENTDIKELSDVFWGNSANKSAVKGRNMGLVVDFAGSVQGNIYTNEPMKGKITAYIGSGFAVTGQYLILTWDITVTVGAGGVFEFQLKYNEETDKYSEFEPEKFSIQFKTGLELYGGIGLSSIASAGIYGAGSMTGVNTFYPKGTVDSLVLAGECGFKVKLFSRTLFSFAIWSGEHEFVQKTGPKLNLSNIEKIDSMLIAGNYASKAGSISEPESGGLWLSNGSYLKLGSDLKGYESDSDFEHIIAKDIYPENRLLTVKTGSSNFPQINVVLLGSDGSRANGNRSRLMNFYFDENKNFISEPVWMFDTDDGTADFDPYAYHSEESGNTYTVWKNAVKELSESASFQEIADNTDIYFSKFQVSSSWYSPERVTDYAERNEGVFATGARVSENASGSPVVTWFTNPVDDPAGVGSSEHSIMLAVKNGTAWESEEAFTLKGVQVTNLDYTVFGGKESLAVSYAKEGSDGTKSYTTEVWQKTSGKWAKAFERKDALNARFIVLGGNGYKTLLWYENGSLYSCDEKLKASRKTPADMVIPTSSYDIYGKFGGNSAIVLYGTKSEEGSENIFAVVSTDGGNTWNSTKLTDIDRDASVNEISLAYTEKNEPILFYSVKNYKDVATNSNDSFESMFGSSGLMVGQDDPRFVDGQTDLYVKARKANRSVEITDATFTDPDNARKGQKTPLKITVHNNGLYDIDSIDIYIDGKKTETKKLAIKAGEEKTFEISYTVPSDAPDRELNVKVGVSSGDKEESTLEAVLGTGSLSVLYTHEVFYKNEAVGYTISNNGFATKKVYEVLFDDATAEKIYEYPFTITGGRTATDRTSNIDGLWIEKGHENVRAFLLTEGEYNKIKDKKFSSIDELEEFLGIGSMKSVSFRGLGKQYVQDFAPLVASKNSNGDTKKDDDSKKDDKKKDDEKDDDEVSSVIPEPEQSEQSVVPEPSGETEKSEGVKPSSADDDGKGDKSTVPSDDDGNGGEGDKSDGSERKGGTIKRILLYGVIPVLLIAAGFIFFLLFKRRNDDDEDEG